MLTTLTVVIVSQSMLIQILHPKLIECYTSMTFNTKRVFWKYTNIGPRAQMVTGHSCVRKLASRSPRWRWLRLFAACCFFCFLLSSLVDPLGIYGLQITDNLPESGLSHGALQVSTQVQGNGCEKSGLQGRGPWCWGDPLRPHPSVLLLT